MLRYTELSNSQKILIDQMRAGLELRRINGQYTIGNGCKLRTGTPNSLWERGYIKECSNQNGIQVFCVNIEIEGFGTKF